MKPSRASTLRWAGALCTGEWPWKCSLWPCPAPTSATAVLGGLARVARPCLRAAAADEEGDAPGQHQHDERADHAGHSLRHPLVADALRAVAGERAAATVVLGPGLREALVLGDPVEAVRAGGGVVAHDAGEQQRDQHAGDHEGARG